MTGDKDNCRLQSDGFTHTGPGDGKIDAGTGSVSQDVASVLHMLAHLAVSQHSRRGLICNMIRLQEVPQSTHEGDAFFVGVDPPIVFPKLSAAMPLTRPASCCTIGSAGVVMEVIRAGA